MNVRIVKTKEAKHSYALYNRGARCAEYDVVASDGTAIYRIRGRFDGYRRSWRLLDIVGMPVFFGSLAECKKEAIRLCSK